MRFSGRGGEGGGAAEEGAGLQRRGRGCQLVAVGDSLLSDRMCRMWTDF